MRCATKLIKIFLLSFLLIHFLVDRSYAQITGSGKEFWLGFMDNYRMSPNAGFPNGLIDIGILEVVAVEAANGSIFFAGQEVNFNLTRGQSFSFSIPDNFNIINRSSGIVENKGIQVRSDGNIMVYAYNNRRNSTDATAILPLPSLSDDYWVMAHFQRMGPDTQFDGETEAASIFLVVGIEDNTLVEITPRSQTIDGRAALAPFQITLNKGQTFQVKSKNLLTASRVRVIQAEGECKRIAVFGGNRWGNNGGVGPDNSHMFTQMLPNDQVSSEFIFISTLSGGSDYAGFFSPDLIGFVSIDGEMMLNPLGLGELGGNLPGGAPRLIEMTNPGFAVLKTPSSNNSGSPTLTYLMGLDQMITQSIFSVRNIEGISTNRLIVIVKAEDVPHAYLNGNSLQNEFSVIYHYPDYAFARITLDQGVHTLENQGGFNAYQYGFGFNESYTFTLFQSQESQEFEVSSSYDFEVTGDYVACLDQAGIWEIVPDDASFQFFFWDFGDGSEEKQGSEVTHAYTTPGEYEVLILAKKSEDPCEAPEEIRITVEVIDNTGEIRGPSKVCPEVEEFDYFFDPNGNTASVEWEVEGGEIVDELERFGVRIRWGAPNENAAVKAVAFTEEGCPGEGSILEIRIRDVLEPDIPTGPEILCIDPAQTYTYEVAEMLPGRGYEWFVEGGEISGSNDFSTVEVSWNLGGSSGSLWYKEFSLNDEYCEGFSDPLQIELNDNLLVSINELNPVLCQGERSGFVSLEVIGGSGNYTYEWSHDPDLNVASAGDLKAGWYSVRVMDFSGCEGILEDIEITEPRPLGIVGGINTASVSCFGRTDGTATFSVQGGEMPYAINYGFAEIIGGDFQLGELGSGDFDLKISDANGCVSDISFSIGSPAPLEVDVSIQKQNCPGSANGALLAIPKGGTAPFTYTWSSGGQNTALAQGLNEGEYEVTVEDARGCIGTGKGILTAQEPAFRMPTGFMPNPSDPKALFQGVSNCPVDFEIRIFNRWGELFYIGNTGWNGTLNGTSAPLGTYVYLVQYEYTIGDQLISKQQRGAFTLVR